MCYKAPKGSASVGKDARDPQNKALRIDSSETVTYDRGFKGFIGFRVIEFVFRGGCGHHCRQE